MFSIVITKLTQIAKSGKTIAQALVDGSLTDEELAKLNTTQSFPANNFNRLNLPEGAYSAQEAMMSFVRFIGPFLSDQRLYELTHTLAKLETQYDNTQAYRTSSLAKCFMIYELERHAQNSQGMTDLPSVFLSHMHDYVLPLCQRLWPNHLESNLNTFAQFNFKNDVMTAESAKKFEKIQHYYEPILSFKPEEFHHDALANVPEKQNLVDELSRLKSDIKKPAPYSSAQKTKDSISQPSHFMQATLFFVKSSNGPLQHQLSAMENEIQKYETEKELYEKVLTQLKSTTDVDALAQYQNLKSKLENDLKAQGGRAERLKAAYTNAVQKITTDVPVARFKN